MPSAWDERNPPIAYLLTFRTYGTWHHGDARGSVDRRRFNEFGMPKMKRSALLVSTEEKIQNSAAFLLDEPMKKVVHQAVIEVCAHRRYDLSAINVRSNHVHTVVSHLGSPEKIVEAFKGYSTRALRRNGLVDNEKIWSRHASTRYLWNESELDKAIKYVLYYQDDEFPSFDEVLKG